MASSPGADPGIDVDGFRSPPWRAAADEKTTSDRTPFAVCNGLISDFASRSNSKVKDQAYSVSKTWGDVLRARVTEAGAGSSPTTDVVCWSKPGSRTQIAVWIEDPAGR